MQCSACDRVYGPLETNWHGFYVGPATEDMPICDTCSIEFHAWYEAQLPAYLGEIDTKNWMRMKWRTLSEVKEPVDS